MHETVFAIFLTLKDDKLQNTFQVKLQLMSKQQQKLTQLKQRLTFLYTFFFTFILFIDQRLSIVLKLSSNCGQNKKKIRIKTIKALFIIKKKLIYTIVQVLY